MASLNSAGNQAPGAPLVAETLQRYGQCLELVPTDPHFYNVSVGLYLKDGIYTVWSFSRKSGIEERLSQIRDQMTVLGGLSPVDSSPIQVRFQCGDPHLRALRFLVVQAVTKSPDFKSDEGRLTIKDTRSTLVLNVDWEALADRFVYHVSGEGEASNAALRLRAVIAGFVRYGEMEKVGDTAVAFPCGQRHDDLVRILMPFSRNVSAVENMIEEEALRGQMTTGTLGFSPT